MMKTIKAVAPYQHPESCNFKTAAYEAWEQVGGQVAGSHYPLRCLHGLVFRFEFPSFFKMWKRSAAEVCRAGINKF